MSIYTKGNARFTVMTQGVIRMEYAENGTFVDGETLFAKRDSLWDATITDNETLTIQTENVTLYYKGGEFTKDSLYADVHADGFVTTWHYGDTNKENLGGTLHTLDGVDGFRPLPDGLLARDGWYVIDDSHTPYFSNDWITNRSDDHKLDLYLFVYGRNYKAALADLAAVSGKMELPRKYFFGSWYSRWWNYTADEFRDIVKEYNENDFPIDILVFDMDWHHNDWRHAEGAPKYQFGYGFAGGNVGWTGYHWNRDLIPDPNGLIEEMRQKGVAVTLNDHPADGVRDTDEVYAQFMDELATAGYTEQVPTVEEKVTEREKAHVQAGYKNFRFNAGNKTYMNAFFNATNAEMEDRGAAFRWLDWQQDNIYPYVNGMNNLTHLKWLNHLYYENSKKGGLRGMSFSRWGDFGDHKHPAYFSGDTTTNWETLTFEIQMTVSAGNVGCFWWSHDIGGFVDHVPGGQGEVYARWVQFGAVSPALRVHMAGKKDLDRRPWTWGEPYCSVMRDAYHLRSVIFPYVYSEAKCASDFSLPLLRALYYDFPNDEKCYQYPGQYMFGEGMMASPVCTPIDQNGEAKTEVYFPDGVWYDWFTGKKYEKGTHVVNNTLNTFPLFVKAGYPVVTQPYTERMAIEPLRNPKILIWAGENGTATLFEDNGISDTDLGLCRATRIHYDDAAKTVELACYHDNYDDGITARDITIELRGTQSITGAVCETHTANVSATDTGIAVTIKDVAPAASVKVKFI